MRCRRCTGLIVVNHGEEYCVNCGYRPFLAQIMAEAPTQLNPDRCPEPGCDIKPKGGHPGCWRHREKIRRQQLAEVRS